MSVSTPTSEEPFLTSDTRRDDSSPASSPENDEDQSSDGLTECGGYTRVLDCGQGTRGNLANRSSFASGNGCEQPLNLSERTASKPARRHAVENTTVHWPQGLPCTPINTDPGHECDSSKRQSPSNNLPYELHGRAEVVLEDGGSARGEEEEEEEHEEAERGSEIEGADPERLKAFNMFVRLFVDENLDRSVPISKQPKEKVQAILASCARQFPEFQERARKRIRTYLKSCRRLRRSGLELNLRSTPPHLTSAVAENMLAMACENESRNAAKRMRLELHQDEPLALDRPSSLQTADFTAASHPTFSPIAPFPSELPHVNGGFRYSQHSYGRRGSSLQSLGPPPPPPAPTQYTPANNGPTDLSMKKLTPGGGSPPSGPGKGSIAQLSPTEVSAVRQLVAGYRESAAFLLRSADELEGLILQHN